MIWSYSDEPRSGSEEAPFGDQRTQHMTTSRCQCL